MAELVEISKKLRLRRTEKKLSLEQIFESTHISIIILRKIESCDFQSVSDVYLRAYLRQYAKFLEYNELLPLIDEVLPPKVNTISAPNKKNIFQRDKLAKLSKSIHISPSVDNNSHKPNFLSVKNLFILVCIVLAPLLLIRGCKNISSIIKTSIEKRNAAKAKTEIQVKEVSHASKSEKRLPSKKLTKQDSSAIKQKLRQSEQKKPSVRIITKDNVFVRVKADDALIFKSMVLKGSQEFWQANDKLEVMISKPSLVLLEIFDKRIPTKNFKKPVTYFIDRKGFTTKK